MRITDTLARPVLTGILSLAVAGTCLAVPGLALASESSEAADAEATAAEAATDGQTITFGGITATVPADYLHMDFEDAMCMATAEDGSVALSIVNGPLEGMPTDAAELETYFSDLATQGAEAAGGTLTGFGTTEEAGTTVYVATMDIAGDTPSSMFVAYIPMEDGTLSVVQVVVDPSVDGAADAGDAIVASVTLADAVEEAEAAESEEAEEASVELTQVAEVGGMQISLPEDFTQDEDGIFANEAGDILLSVTEQVAEDATAITSEDLDTVASEMATELGGEVLDSTVLENDANTNVYAYAMVMTIDDTTLMGILGFVPVADGSLSMVYGLCDGAQADTLGVTLDAIFESIAVA